MPYVKRREEEEVCRSRDVNKKLEKKRDVSNRLLCPGLGVGGRGGGGINAVAGQIFTLLRFRVMRKDWGIFFFFLASKLAGTGREGRKGRIRLQFEPMWEFRDRQDTHTHTHTLGYVEMGPL